MTLARFRRLSAKASCMTVKSLFYAGFSVGRFYAKKSGKAARKSGNRQNPGMHARHGAAMTTVLARVYVRHHLNNGSQAAEIPAPAEGASAMQQYGRTAEALAKL